MQIVCGIIGLLFLVLALLHVPHPSPWLWVPYAAGGVLALLTLIPRTGVLTARLLAIATTAVMFFFFADFFTEVPRLERDWYMSQEGWSVVSLLFGAFTLIPVLSVYSCCCKAEPDSERDRQRRSRNFFSAPHQTRSS